MFEQINIEIKGRVQGVNFRNQAAIFARKNNLVGEVENTREGTVKIIAQGGRADLEKLLDWCQKGYFPAKVQGLSYNWTEARQKFQGFKIRRRRSFLADELSSLLYLGKSVLASGQQNKIPGHVVIIPDGNRRWARVRGWQPWVGHKQALTSDRLTKIFKECRRFGIAYLSLWGFSTENWSRDKKEITFLFKVFRDFLKQTEPDLHRDKIRFRLFGRRDRLPADIIAACERLERETKNYTNLNLQLCLDYGGRDDLTRAFNKMFASGVSRADEKTISQYLDSAQIPDPDLIIRTAGEKRTSGMMAYQSVYSELYFTDVYFPDFDETQFRLAILDYASRVRRFGGTAPEDIAGLASGKLADPEPREI